MEALLERVLKRVMTRGSLGVTTATGRTYVAGTGDPKVHIRFTTKSAERAVLFDPELEIGEAITDGTLVIEKGSITDFLDLVMAQPGVTTPTIASRLMLLARMAGRRIAQFNPRGRSQRNVAHHYDLDGRLYSLFLDSDRQYSCAYFEHPDQSLDDAQLAKKRHLAAKLMLDRPGLKLLDIGCGWGGLGLYMSEVGGADVTGVTLSKEQLAVAQGRVKERGLDRHVDFRLQDYRDVPETFDRIVSVGMFEHVGVAHYGTFFRKAHDLLKEDGVMMLHAIGRQEPPGVTNPWIAKYIFPGGYIPALSEVLPHIEKAGLIVTDIEILRLHYAETLKAWRERFMAHREEAKRLTDERFCRLWEFYLAGSEMAFRHQNMMVFQIQLARRQEAVPITRDYLAAAEERLRAAEFAVHAPPLRLAGE
ncbi:cyclopropane-fatty-acyl-phospholipid synthase [Azorhizobium caulinodans ORS 571]|uniref:Cyclopropane-fatty-acyl-phospholipid synthase n=1 Tax=Azorhizobium caulinodans (strain ATCC 43989 / DSM 5975 / JCM 20966 / LMG 6465 / NBRC 14845 / NCIMB 13405 / ORS 571) TaxID=438753 RepID=A8IMC8_AZOC5|nr:cyclopropane-fatty-acyl-phospholipid synthase family protein [Azorhizobium caulinodans]BAF86527.1 cyclopropane-fatty-acyl-phospholipid synthase [Azorhizobium caulinodans ORS 571]